MGFVAKLRSFAIVLACALAPVIAAAETLVGSNIDSRVLIGLKADAAAVQSRLPDGWTNVPFPGGPLKGANLLLVLIDSALETDADGAPLDPPSRRAVALVGLGKKDDAVRLYVMGILTTVPERNPYGVAVDAEIERSLSTEGPANGGRQTADDWRISTSDGSELRFTLSYTSGKRGWSTGEAFPYSAATPGFSRIYRYEQLVDLVASTGLGKPPSGEFSLTGSVPELADILDSPLEIVAVTDVPVYVRKVYLP